jgi:hypothetical protein
MATLVPGNRNFEELTPVADRRKGSDRRKDIRMASKCAPATLCVGARPPIEVEIQDVSRSGLGIISPSAILIGSSVVVICGGLTISGTVRHCRERLTGKFTAGISITRIVDTEAGKEI